MLYVAIVFLIFSLLPLVKNKHWFFRDFGFARLQMFYISLIGLALSIIFRFSLNHDLAASIAWLIVALFNLALILKFTFIYPKQVQNAAGEKGSFTIMSANVLQSNREYSKLISEVQKHNPDILGLLEVNSIWIKELQTLIDDYPYRIAAPMENRYGMLILSRHELKESEIKFLVEDSIPSIFFCSEIDGQAIRFICAHPAPPSPTEYSTSEQRDKELDLVAASVAEYSEPSIVFGDLNDVAWSDTTKRFISRSGLKDPRVGRGLYNSFNAKYWWVRFPVDHLFVSDFFRIQALKRSDFYGSDHFAMIYCIKFPVKN